MNFVDAIEACFVKYANFKGCASRPEFWWWFVFTLVVTAMLRALSYNLATVFSFATFLPSIAVTARRLHDIDRSGWWQLLYFLDRKSTRLNSSHQIISYAVFCLKKKKDNIILEIAREKHWSRTQCTTMQTVD